MSLYVEVLRMKASLQKYRQRRCCEVGGTTLNFYLKGERTKQRKTENGKLLVTQYLYIYRVIISIYRRVFSDTKFFEKLKNVSSCVHTILMVRCVSSYSSLLVTQQGRPSIRLQSHYQYLQSIESRRVFSEKKIFEKLKNVSSCVHNSRGKMCIIIFFITGHTVSIHLSIYRVIISIYTVPKSFFRQKSFLKN